MKKIILTCLILSLILIPVVSFGDNTKVSITSENININQTTNVKITYSGTNIGRVIGLLEYDTTKLEYISGGNSSENSGIVQLKRAGDGGNIVFNLKFKGIAKGQSTIKLSTSEVYDMEEQYISVPVATKTLSITANNSNPEKTEDTDKKEDNTDSKKADNQSSNTKEPTKTNNNADSEKALNTNTTILILSVLAGVIAIILVILLIKRRRRK